MKQHHAPIAKGKKGKGPKTKREARMRAAKRVATIAPESPVFRRSNEDDIPANHRDFIDGVTSAIRRNPQMARRGR